MQRRIQVRIAVEVRLKTQRTMRLPTPVATHLRTLLPVLPGEQREVLRETQLHLRRAAGQQDRRVTGGSVTCADPLCRGCRVYLQLDFDAACNEPFKWD